MAFERRFATLVPFLAVLSVTGCGGGSGQPVAGVMSGPTPVATSTPVATPTPVATATPTPVATAAPTPTPTPTPSPTGSVVVAPNSLSLLGTGAGNAKNVDVTQANFAGPFTFTSAAAGVAGSCNGIASASGSGPAFTITPSGNGHCVFVVAGGGGKTANLTIDVTVTSVGGK